MINLAKQNRHEGLETALNAEVGVMSHEELENSVALLRVESNRLISRLDARIANDIAAELQSDLELRYGPAFAQWLMGRMPEQKAALAY